MSQGTHSPPRDHPEVRRDPSCAAAPLLAAGTAEAAETPEERVKQRYRETDHVKKFYETNRF